MKRLSQSVHLNPESEEGLEILSVLLAVPQYQRGALIRAVLLKHLKAAALQRWPQLKPKTHEELHALLTHRAGGRSLRRSRAPVLAPAGALQMVSKGAGGPSPAAAEDIEARLDRLDFSRFTS